MNSSPIGLIKSTATLIMDLLVYTPIAGLVVPALIPMTLGLRWLGEACCLGVYHVYRFTIYWRVYLMWTVLWYYIVFTRQCLISLSRLACKWWHFNKPTILYYNYQKNTHMDWCIIINKKSLIWKRSLKIRLLRGVYKYRQNCHWYILF